ncbi:MAG: ACS family MFS transporter [Gammaproteobacteria bacterium]|nr:ACS family MFS transporter [Gammaproteobacteria bacterium]
MLALLIAYIDRVNISVAAIAMQESLGWSETEKGLVLSSFFIGYMAAQIVGGVLADRFGGKRVLGVSLVLWSALTALTPVAASTSFALLIVARIGLGLGEAPLSPAALNLFGKWVPEEERSRAVAFYSSAAILGTLFALLVTGWMVTLFGWPSVFYWFGALGLIYAVFWFTRVFETPDDHPRISSEERELLASNRPPQDAGVKIPWRELLSSPAVWALFVTFFCTSWSLYVFLSWMPSYFASVHGLNITSAGIYTMVPWASMFVMMNVAGWIADRMISRGSDLTFVRKLMQTIGLVGSGTFLYVTRFAASPEIAIASLSAALGLLAFAYSGSAPNVLDIAPRFGGVLFGIMNTLGTLPGIVGVALTGWIVETTGSYDTVLAVAAVISAVGAAAFLVFGSAKKLVA